MFITIFVLRRNFSATDFVQRKFSFHSKNHSSLPSAFRSAQIFTQQLFQISLFGFGAIYSTPMSSYDKRDTSIFGHIIALIIINGRDFPFRKKNVKD